jgi:8-amino-7-oxononanoate synthase
MASCVDSLGGYLEGAAAARREANRDRSRRVLRPLDATRVHDGRRELVNFSSNDYLGLAAHPELAAAARACLSASGCGSGASALVTGYRPEHQRLERDLAEFLEREAVLLFSSGYLANLAVSTALADRGSRIVQDRLCHASLIDAAKLSGARLVRYRHRDIDSLRQQIGDGTAARTLVVTDGVFSMDGDIAPLQQVAGAAEQAEAWLVVDDAHGIGVLGPGGRGSVAEAGLGAQQVPVLVGTLGKAFGAAGAFVAGSRALIEHLVNEGRSYVFTTAPPPAVAAAARAALLRLRDDHWRRERLAELVAQFRAGATRLGLNVAPSDTPIQPLLTGTPESAVRLADDLRQRGFLVVAIRPPTVPSGSSRLRITVSAAHSTDQLESLLEALDECLVERS